MMLQPVAPWPKAWPIARDIETDGITTKRMEANRLQVATRNWYGVSYTRRVCDRVPECGDLSFHTF
jgi:hypothetical protein